MGRKGKKKGGTKPQPLGKKTKAKMAKQILNKYAVGAIKAKGVTAARAKPIINAAVVRSVKGLGGLSSGKGAIGSIVKFITNPSGSCMRLSADAQCNPTSLVDLHLVDDVAITAAWSNNYPSVALGLVQQFFFKDPLRALVRFTPGVPAWEYDLWCYSNGTQGSSFYVKAGDTEFIVPLWMTPTTSVRPHGDALFSGFHKDREGYLWMDPGVKLTVTRSDTTSNAEVVVFWAFQPDDDLLLQRTTLASTVATVTFTMTTALAANGAYVRVSFAAVNNQNVKLQLFADSALDIFAHQAVPGVLEHTQQFVQCRVNACNLLISNASSPLEQNGFITGANLAGATQWYSFVGKMNLQDSAVNDKRFYYNGRFATGLYTYLTFTDTRDMMFQDYANVDTARKVTTALSFPLIDSRYAAVNIKVNSGTTTPNTFPGLTFVSLSSYVLEYSCNDPWPEVRMASAGPQDVEQALWVVGHIDKFFENPTHIQRLAEAARGVGSFLRAHARKIGGALSFLFPKFAPILGPLANLISE